MFFEIGDHTFTHVDLTAIPGWQRDLQVSMTESAIAGAAGVRPRFLRPPYSGGPQSSSTARRRRWPRGRSRLPDRALQLRRGGLAPARRRRIVRNATPPGRRGGVILFHDGGGDRSQTVAALRRLVPRLRAARLSLRPALGAGRDLAAPRSEPPASAAEHLRGELLIGALAAARWSPSVAGRPADPDRGPGRAAGARAGRRLRAPPRRASGGAGPSRPFAPPVSVDRPRLQRGGGDRARRSDRWRGGDYPSVEVIVVDDGSTRRHRRDRREPRPASGCGSCVEDNAGKAAALNAGIAAARHERDRHASTPTPCSRTGTLRRAGRSRSRDERGRRGQPATPRSATGAACSGAGSTSTT